MKFKVNLFNFIIFLVVIGLFSYLLYTKNKYIADNTDKYNMYKAQIADTIKKKDSLISELDSIIILDKSIFNAKIDLLRFKVDSLNKVNSYLSSDIDSLTNSQLASSFKGLTGIDKGIKLREDSVFEVEPIQMRKAVLLMSQNEINLFKLILSRRMIEKLEGRVIKLDSVNSIQSQIISVQENEILLNDSILLEREKVLN